MTFHVQRLIQINKYNSIKSFSARYSKGSDATTIVAIKELKKNLYTNCK